MEAWAAQHDDITILGTTADTLGSLEPMTVNELTSTQLDKLGRFRYDSGGLVERLHGGSGIEHEKQDRVTAYLDFSLRKGVVVKGYVMIQMVDLMQVVQKFATKHGLDAKAGMDTAG